MFDLIVTIVQKDNGEFINKAANAAGANGGTVLLGKGVADNSILQLFGLGESSKDITYNIVESSMMDKIRNAIIDAAKEKRAHFGVLFTIKLNDFIKSGQTSASNTSNSNENTQGDTDMNASYELINVIVNKGYAEDAMDAARKAGAGGGTIIGARGTAREEDADFFGMKIVPEKDLLMILVPTDKKEPIVEAIKNLPCLSEAGSGIVFCTPANDFTLLGKK